MPHPEPKTPDPRLAQAVIGVVLIAQAAYAGASILGSSPGAGDGLRPVLIAAFATYVMAIAVYLVGILRAATWLRPLAIGIAAAGLAIGAVRVASGQSLDDLLFGMAIDGLLIYGLRRPDIRRLYPL